MEIKRFQDDYLGIFTASYLIETEHYNVFIDGGLLIGKDEKLPYYKNGKKNILILTHGHWDHIGAASLTQDFIGEVYIHAGDVPMITNHEWLWDMLFGQFVNDFDLPAAREPMFWNCVGGNVIPNRLIKNGEELVFDNLCFEVIHTPGHSPGSICLLEKNSGIMFAGDSIIGKGFFTGTPQIANFDDYIASMKKLSKYTPTQVLTAHTPVVLAADFGPWLNEGIECALRMLEAAKEFVNNSTDISVGSVAKAIAEKEGKGVGGGTCITALSALRCMPNDERALEILSNYIYGY
ncbi:MAG: MBL fold metallo-hydrolase [Prevotellaceae bacterium]|nr:MBL fold metallo-hydrolase [Prevotellaceae bacterium]